MDRKLLEVAGVDAQAQQRLELLENVRRTRQALDQRETRANEKHRTELATVQQLRDAMQDHCPHPQACVRYCGDATGGFDSADVCELCGKWDKHLPVNRWPEE